jgi:hypothetical protein
MSVGGFSPPEWKPASILSESRRWELPWELNWRFSLEMRTAQVFTWHPIWEPNRFWHFEKGPILMVKNKNQILALSKKSCPVGPELHLPFDASSPLGCCPQSHEILLNKGMKYWDSALNAPGSRTFTATVHIAAVVIGWKRSGNKRTGQTQFSSKFAPKLSFMLQKKRFW